MSFISRRFTVWAFVLTLFAAESASAQLFNLQKLNESPRVLASRRQQIASMIRDAEADGKIDRREKESILHFARLTLPKEEAKRLQERLEGNAAPSAHVGAPVRSRSSAPAAQGAPSSLVATSYAEGVASTDEEAVDQTPAIKPGRLIPSPGSEMDAAVNGFENGPVSGDYETTYVSSGGSRGEIDCDYYDYQMMGCFVQSATPWDNLKLFTSLDSFKGPMDLGNRNANFGIRFGANMGVPLLPARNIGFQLGTTQNVADFHGTQYTGDTCRWQNFTTIAFFRRNPCGPGHFNWGFGHDWLHDHYYRTIKLRQWRIKASYNWDCSNEIGFWTSIPESVSGALLPRPDEGTYVTHFKGLAQGNFFWTHFWDRGARTTGWLGIAEDPGGLVLGVDGEVPISERLALFGKCQYIVPAASGVDGQDKDFWYLTVGIQFTPGRRGNLGRPTDYAPFLPVADNGSFSVREF